MAVWTEWTENKEGLVFRHSTEVEAVEIIDVNNDAIKDPAFANIKFQIIDLTETKVFNVTLQDMQVIAQQDMQAAKLHPKIKVAYVGDSDLLYGIGRMYDGLTSPSDWETELFNTMEEAYNWLGKFGYHLETV